MSETAPLTIRLNPADNVVVARAELMPNTAIPGEDVTTNAPIPRGHKIATRPIAKGEKVIKYDQIIGFAAHEIKVGDHVHTENCEFRMVERDVHKGELFIRQALLMPRAPFVMYKRYQSYLRKDLKYAWEPAGLHVVDEMAAYNKLKKRSSALQNDRFLSLIHI